MKLIDVLKAQGVFADKPDCQFKTEKCVCVCVCVCLEVRTKEKERGKPSGREKHLCGWSNFTIFFLILKWRLWERME